MQVVESVIVTPELTRVINQLFERLTPGQVIASAGWAEIAPSDAPTSGHRLGPDRTSEPSVVIGPPAAVLGHAARASSDFGFITVDAQQAKPWQRAVSWRDDTTLHLWKIGWSPQTVDRVLVANEDSILEFLIGTARRTPATGSTSG